MGEGRILLTRISELNESDQFFFTTHGYETEILPLTEISLRNLSAKEIEEIKTTQWLFFTSQVPVANVLKYAHPSVKIAVIGQKTAQAVIKAGFTPTFISPKETKDMLLSTWQKIYPTQTRILYPKSQLADNGLETILAAHQVKSFVAYENIFPKESQKKLQKVLRVKKITAVYFTSPSSWHRFMSVYQESFQYPLQFFAIGETTKKAIEKSGYTAILKKDVAKISKNNC